MAHKHRKKSRKLGSKLAPKKQQDFRRRKLYLTLTIMAVGMIIAVLWHGWQGWGLGNKYPYNSFLFIEDLRFTDLSDPIKASLLPSPYLEKFSDYFPFTYVCLWWFSGMNPWVTPYFFLGFISLGLGGALMYALRPVIPKWWACLLCAIGLFAFSYPFLFCLDRGNLEIALALLVSISLLFFQKRYWFLGLACLLPAICFKFYPILLLALFIRRRHLTKAILVGVVFLVISVCSMASFYYTLSENWQLWHRNLDYFKLHYVIANWGFSGSASPWNTCKALLVTAYSLVYPSYDADLTTIRVDLLNAAYTTYVIAALSTVLAVTFYAILIERDFFRRVILLLLVATMTAPSGGDYKLLFANIALVVLILIPTKRPFDLWATGLLAFVMIPKKEIFLDYLGRTDAGFHDISIAILLNPPCMLMAMGLLIRDGLRLSTWKHVQRRFWGILKPSLWRSRTAVNLAARPIPVVMRRPRPKRNGVWPVQQIAPIKRTCPHV